MPNKFVTKKFNGDDMYSWAVFRREDVKGMKSPIFMGQAQPVYSGLDMHSARNYARMLNTEHAQKAGSQST